MTEVIKRRHAKAVGQLYYFTGKPCPRGHIAKRNVASRNCMDCVHDFNRDFRKANVARFSAKSLAKYHRNPKKKMKSVRRWQSNNPEKVRIYKEKWKREHPEESRANVRNRRSRRRLAPGRHTAADIRDIARLQRNRCAYCRTKLTDAEVDHIHALSRGGSNDRRNLQLLCQPCNGSKGAKDPIQFAQQRGLLL